MTSFAAGQRAALPPETTTQERRVDKETAPQHTFSQVLQHRREKARSLQEAGLNLYANDFSRNAQVAQVLARSEHLSEVELEEIEARPAVAGRIVALRSFGKATFFHIQDETQRMQVFAQRDTLGADQYSLFKKFEVGDIVGVVGGVFRTKTGELTIRADEVRLLTKSLRPLPEKYHGLKDVETRYRQRYVDLIVNERAREVFRARTLIVAGLRRFLDQRGFMEVETPMMQPIPGGATARPFITHHNALDMQLYLRIAPELYLKRLLVGGFEKVYEINRNFRNEGISTQHNPEFTMLEFYWSYATYTDLMDMSEQMLAGLAEELTGSTTVTYQGEAIELAAPWRRLTFHEAIRTLGGVDTATLEDPGRLREVLARMGEKSDPAEKTGKLQARLFDLLVEPKLIQPTFITQYPLDISPLSRRNETRPDLTDRFELFICGREMANGFSELNDPADQRERFEAQVREKEAGDEEAHFMDEDYVRALEYGMPPAAGEGIGIDRLVMLLTDSPSIREVILFPLLKPEAPAS